MGMGGTLRVSGVTLRFMGQKSLLARYPMHWHMMGPVDGQYFAGSSVWRSFNRCVTVHGTDNARVESNVCYDHLGHGYFLEDGAETGNLIAGNLGLGTRTAGRRRPAPTDSRAATFWITNPDNTVRGQRGRRLGGRSASGTRCRPRRPASRPGSPICRAPPRCASSATTSPTPTGGAACTWTTGRRPTAPPRPCSTRRAPIRPMPTRRSSRTSPGFTAYKHSGRAVWLRGRDHRLTDAILADNAIGATFASSETFVEDALFVGESANNGGTLCGRPAAPGLRVLRRAGGRGPGDVRQLHRRRARSRRARWASSGTTASR